MNTENNMDELITKYLSGEASPEEAIQIEIWKSTSSSNLDYFEKMERTWALIQNRPIIHSDGKKAWSKLKSKLYKNTIFHWYYGLAACLGIGLLVTLLFLKNDYQDQSFATNTETMVKTLADKSVVDVEPESKLVVVAGFGKNHRKIQLQGKAQFKVEHNEKMPFIIETSGVYIEDLGTVFTVESRPTSDTVFVVVSEGIVRLYDDFGHEIIVKAGEKAWYIRSLKQIVTDQDTRVVRFDFRDASLDEVVMLLRETYEVDIQLVPKEIGRCKITTQFFDEEIATMITIIATTLDFTFQFQNKTYKIEGKPCI